MYAENWTMEKLLNTMEGAVGYAVENDIPVMFVTEDTTRSKPEDIVQVYQRALSWAFALVCATRGARHARRCSQPLGFIDEHVIKDAGYRRSDIEVNWHGHQDRGLGVANNLAAVQAGADVIHGTALGLGTFRQRPLDQTW